MHPRKVEPAIVFEIVGFTVLNLETIDKMECCRGRIRNTEIVGSLLFHSGLRQSKVSSTSAKIRDVPRFIFHPRGVDFFHALSNT